MGISAIMVEWLERLEKRGVFPGNGDLMEVGPQDLYVTKNVVLDVSRRLKTVSDPDLAVETIFRRLSIGHRATRLFYGLFGIDQYYSIDKFDGEADWKVDLNHPTLIERQFSIVTNFGTSEHVFNVAQSIETTMGLVAPGGVALFVIPAFGHLNHGFFNVHPTAWLDLAFENHYQIVDFQYIDDFVHRAWRRESLPLGQPAFAFDELPIDAADLISDRGNSDERLATKVAQLFVHNHQLDDPATEGRRFDPKVADYCFAAFRKTAASPTKMVFPNQASSHSAMPLRAQLAKFDT